MKNRKPGSRIIGGIFKGTNIPFKPSKELRPTENRTRETLFNWLMLDIADAVCLDMFSGTGALGFEALSRGAKEVVFIEKSKLLCESISKVIHKLSLENRTTVINSDSIKYSYKDMESKFNVLFLDPPFRKSLLHSAYTTCLIKNILKEDALIYVESETGNAYEFDKWKEIKSSKAGQTQFSLFTNEVKEHLIEENSSFPFLRSAISRVGFDLKAIPYSRNERFAGKSNYNFYSMLKFAVAGILASTTLPLRFPIYFFPFWLGISTFLLLGSINNELLWKYFIFFSIIYLVLILSFISIYLARIYKNGLMRANAYLIKISQKFNNN